MEHGFESRSRHIMSSAPTKMSPDRITVLQDSEDVLLQQPRARPVSGLAHGNSEVHNRRGVLVSVKIS